MLIRQGLADQTPSKSRRQFIKVGVAAVGGAAVTSAVAVPLFLNQNSQNNSQLAAAQKQIGDLTTQLAQAQQQAGQLQSQVSGLQTQIGTMVGFLTLNPKEQVLVEAIAETVIPSDSNGPGAKEAGAIYFIDKQLAGEYGHSGNMYMQGPFVMPGQKGPITVQGVTYPGGSPAVRQGAGTRFQYSKNMREFWRLGLSYLEGYSQTAYGAPFESLTADKQTQVLTDLWNNKPTNFADIIPQDFFAEVHDMVIMGFFCDPLYGGNQNMVGWAYVGHNGVNLGNAYGEGMTTKQLMVMNQPVRLKPLSLAQLQKAK